jgi:dolichol-phosphate mannosyltransferase
MLAVAQTHGVDVVYGVRRNRRSDTLFKRGSANLYYRAMRRVAGSQMPHDAGDFRLVSRRVVEAVRQVPPHGRVYRLLIPWFGFPSAEVTFIREARAAGTTKYSLSKMVALAFDSVTAFSSAPLRLATWFGLFGGLVGVLAIVWSFYGWLSDSVVPGWASMLAIAGFFGSVQLICLGLLGEYVARLFASAQKRPPYLVGYDSLQDTHKRAGHP